MKPHQLRQLHAILNKLGLIPYKVDYVCEVTDGRETSTTQLTDDEAEYFIWKLNSEGDWLGCSPSQPPLRGGVASSMPLARQPHPLDQLRKKVLSCFWSLNYYKWDAVKLKNVADMVRIQATLVKHWGKELNDYDKTELQKVIAVLQSEWIPFYNKKAK